MHTHKNKPHKKRKTNSYHKTHKNHLGNKLLNLAGGSCSSCQLSNLIGGGTHRSKCKCSNCKQNIKGGSSALVGASWSADANNISNHYSLNTYNNDVARQMIDVNAPPQMKAGKRRQKGGALSNFLGQDFINLGRQMQFGIGSAYNALAGYNTPVNPLPWNGQYQNSSKISALST